MTRPWLKFFQAREGLNKKKLANETSEKRQARLNRERKPPIKKVDVFLWDWSDEDPHELVCTRVTRREGEDILSSYSDLQLVYDPYSNVWDACKYFGETDNNSDDEPMFCPLSAGISDTPVPSVVVDDQGTSEQAEHEAFCYGTLFKTVFPKQPYSVTYSVTHSVRHMFQYTLHSPTP